MVWTMMKKMNRSQPRTNSFTLPALRVTDRNGTPQAGIPAARLDAALSLLLRRRRWLLRTSVRDTNKKVDQVRKHESSEDRALQVLAQNDEFVAVPETTNPKRKGTPKPQIIKAVLKGLLTEAELHAFGMHVMPKSLLSRSSLANEVKKFRIDLRVFAQFLWAWDQSVVKFLGKLKVLPASSQPPVLLRHALSLC